MSNNKRYVVMAMMEFEVSASDAQAARQLVLEAGGDVRGEPFEVAAGVPAARPRVLLGNDGAGMRARLRRRGIGAVGTVIALVAMLAMPAFAHKDKQPKEPPPGKPPEVQRTPNEVEAPCGWTWIRGVRVAWPECRYQVPPAVQRPPVVIRPVYPPRFPTICEAQPRLVGVCVPLVVLVPAAGPIPYAVTVPADWCRGAYCVGKPRPVPVVKAMPVPTVPAVPVVKVAPKKAAPAPRLVLPFGR